MHHIFCYCDLNLLTALAKKKNLLTDARLNPGLRTQIQFGRLRDPTFGKLATPGHSAGTDLSIELIDPTEAL